MFHHFSLGRKKYSRLCSTYILNYSMLNTNEAVILSHLIIYILLFKIDIDRRKVHFTERKHKKLSVALRIERSSDRFNKPEVL